jgi:hypothetical protein
MLPQARVIAELLRFDPANHPLGLGDKLVELLIGTDAQRAKRVSPIRR